MAGPIRSSSQRRAARRLLAVAPILGTLACGGGPQAVLVRFADDMREDVVAPRCEAAAQQAAQRIPQDPLHFDPDAHVAAMGAAVTAQMACLEGDGRLTSAAAPFVGKTLRCDLVEDSPVIQVRDQGFTAAVSYPGDLQESPGLALTFSREIANFTDRGGFLGRWAFREKWPDHVRYRHEAVDLVLGGRCDGSNVYGFVETLSVYPKTIVLRDEWKGSALGLKHSFSELRCSMP